MIRRTWEDQHTIIFGWGIITNPLALGEGKSSNETAFAEFAVGADSMSWLAFQVRRAILLAPFRASLALAESLL